MSKHTPRLNKIEDTLNTNMKRVASIHIINWDLPEGTGYFKDEVEEDKYQKWRINSIEKENEHKGLLTPMRVFRFDENDVKTYIKEFHKHQESTLGLKYINLIKTIKFDKSFFKDGENSNY